MPTSSCNQQALAQSRKAGDEIISAADGTKRDNLHILPSETLKPIIGPLAQAAFEGFGIGDPFPSSNQGSRVPPLPSTAMIIDNVLIEAVQALGDPYRLILVGAGGPDADTQSAVTAAPRTRSGSPSPVMLISTACWASRPSKTSL